MSFQMDKSYEIRKKFCEYQPVFRLTLTKRNFPDLGQHFLAKFKKKLECLSLADL